jgi:hypothetical protein
VQPAQALAPDKKEKQDVSSKAGKLPTAAKKSESAIKPEKKPLSEAVTPARAKSRPASPVLPRKPNPARNTGVATPSSSAAKSRALRWSAGVVLAGVMFLLAGGVAGLGVYAFFVYRQPANSSATVTAMQPQQTEDSPVPEPKIFSKEIAKDDLEAKGISAKDKTAAAPEANAVPAPAKLDFGEQTPTPKVEVPAPAKELTLPPKKDESPPVVKDPAPPRPPEKTAEAFVIKLSNGKANWSPGKNNTADVTVSVDYKVVSGKASGTSQYNLLLAYANTKGKKDLYVVATTGGAKIALQPEGTLEGRATGLVSPQQVPDQVAELVLAETPLSDPTATANVGTLDSVVIAGSPKVEPPKDDSPKIAKESPKAQSGNEMPAELVPLVTALKSGKPKEQIKAAEDLAARGEKASPAARALCETIVNPVPEVTRSALQALEKVAPALHEPVFTMVVDGKAPNHLKAIEALQAKGAEAKPAVPLLLFENQKCRDELQRTLLLKGGNTAIGWGQPALMQIITASMVALEDIAAEEPQVLKTIIATTSISVNVRFQVQPFAPFRKVGVELLGQSAAKTPEFRKEILTALTPMLTEAVAVTSDPRQQNQVQVVNNFGVIESICTAMWKCGKEANDTINRIVIPLLKDFEFHKEDAVRTRAKDLRKQIEAGPDSPGVPQDCLAIQQLTVYLQSLHYNILHSSASFSRTSGVMNRQSQQSC